ncbi:MAG: hypothetical protein BJ554DRAFT_7606, partial [Olpidium bornovanus]
NAIQLREGKDRESQGGWGCGSEGDFGWDPEGDFREWGPPGGHERTVNNNINAWVEKKRTQVGTDDRAAKRARPAAETQASIAQSGLRGAGANKKGAPPPRNQLEREGAQRKTVPAPAKDKVTRGCLRCEVQEGFDVESFVEERFLKQEVS